MEGEDDMSRKRDLKRAIQESEEEIESLEQKRVRSQAALMKSVLNESKPNEMDVEYFKTFSSLIDVERANLRRLKAELEKLKKK